MSTWGRCIWTMISIVGVISGVAVIRGHWLPPMPHEIADAKTFWMMKTHCDPDYDLIVVGDSRTYRGISPLAMRAALPNIRILNFGYSNGGLAWPLLEAVESKLDPNSHVQIILLGVTPYSLTRDAARNEHYLSFAHGKGEHPVKPGPVTECLRVYFDPIVVSPLLALHQNLNTDEELDYHQEFYDDGWVASWTLPEDPTRALASYRTSFENSKVSGLVVDQLLEQVAEWRGQGIHVLAFRPPTTSKMIALERELSAFDEAKFVAKFGEAGGTWIEVAGDAYRSYDGSHLHKDAAERFSRELAIAIRERLFTGR